jgi:hypothetical protein
MAKLSPEQRGYGHAHRARRKRFAPLVEAGLTRWARCNEFIQPGEPWDLGHVDGTEHTVYSGPEHRRCNRQTATHRAQLSRAFGARPRATGEAS